MTQWEYNECVEPMGRILLSTLYDFGLAGWELVTIISRPGLPERAVFKRPMAPAPKHTTTKKVTF